MKFLRPQRGSPSLFPSKNSPKGATCRRREGGQTPGVVVVGGWAGWEGKTQPRGDSSRDLVGMVSSPDPFKGWNRDLQRSGMKFGHGLNHLAGLFLFEGKKCPGFFFVKPKHIWDERCFYGIFFLGGRNECEVCFELFVPRNTFGILARYSFGTPSFIFGPFFWKTSLFWRLFKKSKFLGFDTSTYIRNIYRCMGRKHPSDSRDLWLGVSRIFCFEIQIHGFFPSLCRFHLASIELKPMDSKAWTFFLFFFYSFYNGK